jgi:broad specificity phosphatase PhoE
MAAIYLVRHGQASYGTADYDKLSDLGRTQSRIVGAALRQRGVRPAVIVRGDMVRHAETAAEALAAHGDDAPTGTTPADTTPTDSAPTDSAPTDGAPTDKVVVDDRWNEYDFLDVVAAHADTSDGGRARMGTLSSEQFQDVMDGSLRNWLAAGAGGGASETWAAFDRRVADALADVAAGLASGQSAVVFTSGGPIAAVCARILGLPAAGFISLNRVMVNGAVTVLITGRRGIRLTAMNEHGHLERPEGGLRTYR